MAQQLQNGNLLPNLEILLSSTFVTHPSRVSSLIKDVMQMIEKDTAESSVFLQGFNQRARLQEVLGPNSNWALQLNQHDASFGQVQSQPESNGIKKDTHAYYLTTFFPLRRTPRNLNADFFSSAFELIKVIRDKHVHFKDFPEEGKRALDWATEITGNNGVEFVLRDDLWLEYWNSRFPKLFSFIWMEFYDYRDRLYKYYPLNLDTYRQQWDHTPSGFATRLNRALQKGFAKRGLEGYFINEMQNIKLDFRRLSSTLCSIANYEGSSALYMKILGQKLTIVFANSRGEQTALNLNIPNNCLRSLSVIIKLSGRQFESDQLKQFVSSERVIILLQNTQEKERALEQIQRALKIQFRPVAWKDLEISEKYVMFQKKIQVQNKVTQLLKILPADDRERDRVLAFLEGSELQNLFRNSVSELFAKCIPPKEEDVYIKRRIIQVENSFQILQDQVANSINETDWIRDTNSQLTFLCDKAGNGKSIFSCRFAEQSPKFLVLNVYAKKFGLYLNQQYPNDVESIVNTFSNIFELTSFEKMVLNTLLQGRIAQKQVLLIIDGLDEASDRLREQVLTSVVIIQNCLSNVQVFVTMRLHLLHDTREFSRLTASYCKLSGLTTNEKIKYLIKYWKKSINNPEQYNNLKTGLAEFARKFTEIRVSKEFEDVLGVPLQLRMIGEIYKENVLRGDFSIDVHSFNTVTKFLQKFIHSKCEIYCRDKMELLGVDLANNALFIDTKRDMLLKHTYYALKHVFFVFEAKEAEWFKIHFLPFFEEARSKQGIYDFGIIKTLQPLRFMHSLVAEYLIAWFYKEALAENGIYRELISALKRSKKWNDIDDDERLGPPFLHGRLIYYYAPTYIVSDWGPNRQVFQPNYPTIYQLCKSLVEEESGLETQTNHKSSNDQNLNPMVYYVCMTKQEEEAIPLDKFLEKFRLQDSSESELLDMLALAHRMGVNVFGLYLFDYDGFLNSLNQNYIYTTVEVKVLFSENTEDQRRKWSQLQIGERMFWTEEDIQEMHSLDIKND